MTRDEEIFRAEVAAALRVDDEASTELGEHPTLDELEAYGRERLSEADCEPIREHLAACRHCFDRLAELDDFVGAGAAGPPEVRRLDEASAWRAFRSQLRAELPQARRSWPEGKGRGIAAWAAVLVVGIGLGFLLVQEHREVAELRREIGRLSQPQSAATLVELFPESTVRGPTGERSEASEGESERVALDEVDHLTLVLHLPEPPAASRLVAEIVGAEGNVVWAGRVERDAYGTVTLGIPRSFLPAGIYAIDLYAGDHAGGDRKGEPVESFRFELVSDSPLL